MILTTEYSLTHVSGPEIEPVTLEEAKAAIRIDPDVSIEDADLSTKISAARIEAETYLGRKIGTQVWDVTLDWWPAYAAFQIPLNPVQSIDSITYNSVDGTTQAVDPVSYTVSPNGLMWLKPGYWWPSVDLMPFGALTMRVTVGIQTVSDGGSPPTYRWPANIRLAILYRVGTHYRIREDMTLGTTMQAATTGAFERLLNGSRDIGI